MLFDSNSHEKVKVGIFMGMWGTLLGLLSGKIQKNEMFTKEKEIATYMVHG